MIGRNGVVRARIAFALLLLAVCLLPACGRKAKPQPLWGQTAPGQIRFVTR
jgi:hypothetical protein